MNENVPNSSDEASVKDLAIKLKSWGIFLFSKWRIISLIGFIGAVSGFIYANNQKEKYTAKITFVVEEAKGASTGLGGLMSLAGQFGVDIGGGSGGDLLSGDNILLYFRSPSLAREVLLSKYDSVGQKSIADEYANVYEMSKNWQKDRKIGKVNFPILDKIVIRSRLQDSLLNTIINKIITTQFNVIRTDRKAGFIDVSVTMHNELLTKTYCERIVQKVVERYIKIKTQRQNATVQILQKRVDSIANLLKQKTIAGASLQNSSSIMDINPLYKTETSVAVESTLRDKTLLSTIFANITQNLELAKFTLSQETPVIQIIDEPILPLKKEKVSRLKSVFLSGFAFSFLTILIFVANRLYRDFITKLFL